MYVVIGRSFLARFHVNRFRFFLRCEDVCQTSYADKKGKYQDQKGLTLPFVVGANHRE